MKSILLIILLLNEGLLAEKFCDIGWKQKGDICFKLISNYPTMSNALATEICREIGDSLAVLDTKDRITLATETSIHFRNDDYISFPKFVWVDSILDAGQMIQNIRSSTTDKCFAFVPKSKLVQRWASVPCEAHNFRPGSNIAVNQALCQKMAYNEEPKDAHCDEGWHYFEEDDSCNRIFKDEISSAEAAQIFCKSHNSGLSTIKNHRKRDFIVDLQTELFWNKTRKEGIRLAEKRINQIFVMTSPPRPVVSWIALFREESAEEYKWQDGTTIDEELWAKDLPNSEGLFDSCAVLHSGYFDENGYRGAILKESCYRYGVVDHWESFHSIACQKPKNPATQNMPLLPITIPLQLLPQLSSLCLPGWSYKDAVKKCYRLFPVMTYSASIAKNFCAAQGGRLPSVIDEVEKRALYEASKYEWSPQSGRNQCWVGLSKNDSNWIWDYNNIPASEDIFDSKIVYNTFSTCATYDPSAGAFRGIGQVRKQDCEVKAVYPVDNIVCVSEPFDSVNVSTSPCDEGWTFLGSDCYKVAHAEEYYSFEECEKKCAEENSHLASLTTEEEINIVSGLVDIGATRSPTRRRTTLFLTGLHNKDNKWQWKDGEDRLPDDVLHEHNIYSCFALDPLFFYRSNGKWRRGKLVNVPCNYIFSLSQSNFTLNNFICKKRLLKHSVEGSFTFQTTYPYLIVMVAVVLSSFVTILAIFLYTRSRSVGEFSKFVENSSSQQKSIESGEEKPLVDKAQSLEFKLDDLNYVKLIGSGRFGYVYSADFSRDNSETRLAVKRCLAARNVTQLTLLLNEISTLRRLPFHPNIVTMVAAITTDLKKTGQLYIVMEYCEEGSLFKYISKLADSHYVNELRKDSSSSSDYYNIKEDPYINSVSQRRKFVKDELRTTDLVYFAVQIANGLSHLAESKCVHRDLAARNVLLTSNMICKISDFGLSQFMDQTYYNTQTTSEEVAFRWNAPEALQNKNFSLASDIWSFGILLFELFSLGKQPYYHVMRENVVKTILEGEINEQPEFAHNEIYSLMKRCWSLAAEDRPTAAECYDFLRNHLLEANRMKVGMLENCLAEEIERQKVLISKTTLRDYYNI